MTDQERESVQAAARVVRSSGDFFTDEEKLVFGLLADICLSDGVGETVIVTQDSLALQAGKTTSAITRAISGLRQKNVIETQRVTLDEGGVLRRPNMTRLRVEAILKWASENGANPVLWPGGNKVVSLENWRRSKGIAG